MSGTSPQPISTTPHPPPPSSSKWTSNSSNGFEMNGPSHLVAHPANDAHKNNGYDEQDDDSDDASSLPGSALPTYSAGDSIPPSDDEGEDNAYSSSDPSSSLPGSAIPAFAVGSSVAPSDYDEHEERARASEPEEGEIPAADQQLPAVSSPSPPAPRYYSTADDDAWLRHLLGGAGGRESPTAATATAIHPALADAFLAAPQPAPAGPDLDALFAAYVAGEPLLPPPQSLASNTNTTALMPPPPVVTDDLQWLPMSAPVPNTHHRGGGLNGRASAPFPAVLQYDPPPTPGTSRAGTLLDMASVMGNNKNSPTSKIPADDDNDNNNDGDGGYDSDASSLVDPYEAERRRIARLSTPERLAVEVDRRKAGARVRARRDLRWGVTRTAAGAWDVAYDSDEERDRVRRWRAREGYSDDDQDGEDDNDDRAGEHDDNIVDGVDAESRGPTAIDDRAVPAAFSGGEGDTDLPPTVTAADGWYGLPAVSAAAGASMLAAHDDLASASASASWMPPTPSRRRVAPAPRMPFILPSGFVDAEPVPKRRRVRVESTSSHFPAPPVLAPLTVAATVPLSPPPRLPYPPSHESSSADVYGTYHLSPHRYPYGPAAPPPGYYGPPPPHMPAAFAPPLPPLMSNPLATPVWWAPLSLSAGPPPLPSMAPTAAGYQYQHQQYQNHPPPPPPSLPPQYPGPSSVAASGGHKRLWWD
ncbi:hypothetical protein BC828DRAFT_409330 [Blastocladiella britannica]|nr:hypothetical protein BC828DRAFT_409330 [Blastocladiella britannica]